MIDTYVITTKKANIEMHSFWVHILSLTVFPYGLFKNGEKREKLYFLSLWHWASLIKNLYVEDWSNLKEHQETKLLKKSKPKQKNPNTCLK